MFPVPTVTAEENTIKKFYRYFLTQNVPLYISDGAKDWPALQKWQDLGYLRNEFGPRKLAVTVMTSYQQQNPNSDERFIFDQKFTRKDQYLKSMGEFLHIRNEFKDRIIRPTSSHDKPEPNHMKLYYLDNVLSTLSLNQNLVKDIKVPEFLSRYLRLQKIGLTMWGEFERRPTFNLKERVVCMVQGKETFRMVSSIFKQNMYSGVFEELGPLETPINLFEKDPMRIRRYQLMKVQDIFEVQVEQGGCLFIPSYYWF